MAQPQTQIYISQSVIGHKCVISVTCAMSTFKRPVTVKGKRWNKKKKKREALVNTLLSSHLGSHYIKPFKRKGDTESVCVSLRPSVLVYKVQHCIACTLLFRFRGFKTSNRF